MLVNYDQWDTLVKKLNLLFHQSFDREIDENYLTWRYLKNPYDKFNFSIKSDENKLLSSYSVSAIDLYYSKSHYKSALSMTTMTHPTARGLGYFPMLANDLYEELLKKNVGLVWGFPNLNSHYIFIKKLLWKDIYEIPTMQLVVKMNIYKKSDSILKDNDFNYNYKHNNNNLIKIYKNTSYLRWRYATNPTNKYDNFIISAEKTVSSYIVTKLYNDSVDLIDIQTANTDEAKILLSHIIKCYSDQGFNTFNCWCPIHHCNHEILEKLGFINTSPITYFGGLELNNTSTPKGWHDYANWYIQMGDSDVY